MKNVNNYNLWTALITPLDSEGNVQLDDLEKLLRQQEIAGNGILILGSTGEALNLSSTEKKDILRFTISLNLNVPIMVGVGGIHIESTLNWLSFCESVKVDAYLLVTPLYAKPGIEGQVIWFETLLESVTKPCVLYNVPSRTGKKLEFEVIKRLCNHENFWAIKEASGSTDDFSKYVEIVKKSSNKNTKVFSGDDILMPEFSKLGAKGLISVASNSWPTQTNSYCNKALNNQLNEEDITLWKTACDLLFSASNPIPVKCLIHAEKTIETDNMKLPLISSDLLKKDLESLMKYSVQIKNWK